MQSMQLSGAKILVALSNKKALIVGVGALRLSIDSTSMLVTVVNKEFSKTKTSFPVILDINLSYGFFSCHYNT